MKRLTKMPYTQRKTKTFGSFRQNHVRWGRLSLWKWVPGISPGVELMRNVMVHAQKPHFVFRLNGRVHLNRWGSQFSRLLAAEVCASALVMLDTPRCEVVWEYWVPTPFASFPFTSPPVRHRVPSHSERNIEAAGAFGWRPTTLVEPKVEKIRGLNLPEPLGPPRPVAGYLYFTICIKCIMEH